MSKKRKQLLNVAEQLFYDYGFHGVGLKQIIQEANVATMTLYNHFSSKDKLVEESIRHREERYWAYMDTVNQHTETPFIALAEQHGRFLSDVSPQGCMFLRAIEVYAETNPEIAQIARDHKAKLLRFFEELGESIGIKEHKDFSYQFLLILEGATSMTQITNSEQATAHAITMTKRLLETYH
ncbi:TetR/AcrR family transcriptional regulator [Pontibacillus sp. ALD_SL1]|uniref:TetR/AcrR family transcriptional regulator n=1 Tax=Pontibacillus sp. ALD_SL1 TaxID=2777185 RepID=UPI001A969BD9|nr:TetR/AcrR family transcriptional regulator [Pontibacillus sp. ALD_SL1]QST01233.1 TetR/AcrR family transcriptional regulator [Pontibacillus sp. ALD_SL1]